jgi:peroxiredoxin
MAKTKKLVVGDKAPDGRTLNADGQEVSLADFWAEGPVLLTFLRHFG